jgi:hypothetical protein
MRRRQRILGLLGSSRRRSLFVFSLKFVRKVDLVGRGGFWRFLSSRVGDHPQEDFAKKFLQVKAAFSFCDEFSPFGDNNSQNKLYRIFLFSKLNCQKSKKKFA